VEAFANMREAAHLGAEADFVRRLLTKSVPAEIGQVIRGDLFGLGRAGAMLLGTALAGAGHLSGRRRLHRADRAAAGRRRAPAAVGAIGRETR